MCALASHPNSLVRHIDETSAPPYNKEKLAKTANFPQEMMEYYRHVDSHRVSIT